MGQRVRVQNFTVSADGYGTGEGQSLEHPFGHADPGELVAWGTATASWPGRPVTGGSRGLDDYFTRDFSNGIGAEIMGRNKFGPQRGPWADHDWTGPSGPHDRDAPHTTILPDLRRLVHTYQPELGSDKSRAVPHASRLAPRERGSIVIARGARQIGAR